MSSAENAAASEVWVEQVFPMASVGDTIVDENAYTGRVAEVVKAAVAATR